MILVFKSFSVFIPQVWDLLKFCKCPQHEENSGFLLHSFAKHRPLLVFALGHLHTYPAGPVGSTPKIALEFKSILFSVAPVSLLHTRPPLLAARGTFKDVGLSLLSY